jgi:hypothetical protein
LFLYRCNWIAFSFGGPILNELGISEDCLPGQAI